MNKTSRTFSSWVYCPALVFIKLPAEPAHVFYLAEDLKACHPKPGPGCFEPARKTPIVELITLTVWLMDLTVMGKF